MDNNEEARYSQRVRILNEISDSHKLTKVQGLELMKDSVLDFTVDMYTDLINTTLQSEMRDSELKYIYFWSKVLSDVWLADNLDELVTLFKEKVCGVDLTEETDMLIDWLISMFVEGRRANMMDKTHSEVMKELVQQKTDEIGSKLGVVFVALSELYDNHINGTYPELSENDVNTIKELTKDINILFAILHPDKMNEW